MASAGAQPPSNGTPFDDVTPEGVHTPNIAALAAQGWLEGTECAEERFCPDDSIERWTMAVWMIRALGEEPSSEPNGFADVDSGYWWAPYTQRLREIGVTSGCALGPLRYCPDDPVSRGQMAAFLTRAFELEEPDDPVDGGFADVAGSVFETRIEALAASGITQGCRAEPRLFCPDEPVTRAQMATFLVRALEHRAAAVETSHVPPRPVAKDPEPSEVDAGDVPAVTVFDIAEGRDRDLRSYLGGDQDLLLWFFAPW